MLVWPTPVQSIQKAVLKSILFSHPFNYFTLSTKALSISFPWKLPCPHLQHCSTFSYSSPVWGFNLLTPSHPPHSPMTADFLQRPVCSSKSLFRCHFYCGSYRDAVNSTWPHAGKKRKSVFSVIVLSLNIFHFFLQDACLMRLLSTTKMYSYRICCLKAAKHLCPVKKHHLIHCAGSHAQK